MSIKEALFITCLMAALGSITTALNSPCPNFFQYSLDQPEGQWSGTLKLWTDSELYGVWIRLIFNEDLKELTVDDKFYEVKYAGDKQYLIKNPNVLLKAKTQTNVKITVKYDGNKVPSLIGYRLNAKILCPDHDNQNITASNKFNGDLNDKDFLQSLIIPKLPSVIPICGNNNQKSSNQWPWQAAIFIQDAYTCGATLISPRHVITSAHCVLWKNSDQSVPPHSVSVYLGKTDLSGKNDHEQKIGVEKIVLYPGYDGSRVLNDLAVIQLDKIVELTDNTQPICLGEGKIQEIGGILVGYSIGKNGNFGELTEAKVKRLSDEECLKSDPNFYNSFSTDNAYCGKLAEDNSVCLGDSGSGLASLRGGSKPLWELRGVVTLGVALQNKNVCDSESNIVYLADVANYIKWIRSVIS